MIRAAKLERLPEKPWQALQEQNRQNCERKWQQRAPAALNFSRLFVPRAAEGQHHRQGVP